jgi:hypothetical protein
MELSAVSTLQCISLVVSFLQISNGPIYVHHAVATRSHLMVHWRQFISNSSWLLSVLWVPWPTKTALCCKGKRQKWATQKQCQSLKRTIKRIYEKQQSPWFLVHGSFAWPLESSNPPATSQSRLIADNPPPSSSLAGKSSSVHHLLMVKVILKAC